MSSSTQPTLLDRMLRPFAQVKAGEGLVALLLFACVFTILCAYYVLKTAREGLILSGGMFGLRGDELKIYATGVMAMLFVVVVPCYGALASRVSRIKLIKISYVAVIGCLALFFVLGRAGAPIGLVFFIWLGLINIFLVAQFWSYTNDLYTEEQGKRLFAIIAIGGSLGAIVGPKLAAVADTYSVMLIAGLLLIVCLALLSLVEGIQIDRGAAKVATAPIEGPNGFELVRRDRYLLLIAAMSVIANLVNTTGEYILSSFAADHAASITADPDERREIIKQFYSDFFFWVNLVGFLVQAFLVSRVIKRLGVRAALFVLPVVAFGTYGAVAAIGGLALFKVAKIAENSTDYSLQNTVRQALWLPTSRAAKYKAKAAIDTFFVRFGDTVSAILVGVGLHQLDLGVRELSVINILLILVWVAIASGIGRRYAGATESSNRNTPMSGRPALAAAATIAVVLAGASVAGAEPVRPGHESGRVDTVEEGDSTARLVMRGVLVVPKSLVWLAMQPLEGVVWVTERYQLIDRFDRLMWNDDRTIGLLPTLRLEAGFGFNAGAHFVHKDLFGERERLDLRASGGGRYRQRYAAALRSGNRFGRLAFESEAEYERRPRDPFYGIGNADGMSVPPIDPIDSIDSIDPIDPIDNGLESRFRHDLMRVKSIASLRIGGGVSAHVSNAIADHELAGATTGTAIDDAYMADRLAGLDGYRNTYSELELRWDTRRTGSPNDAKSNPSTGGLVALFAGRSHALENGVDFWRYGADLQRFVRVADGPRVLVFRAHVEGVTSSIDRIPFVELPRLGGPDRLRGYAADRFRDKLAATAALDYRFDLNRDYSAAVFVDAGRVYRDPSDVSLDNLRFGYGVALEAHSERSFLARLSLASSIDGGVFFNFSLDPVFEVDGRVQRR